MVEKLFSDAFLKNQNWAYLWINSLNFPQLVFILYQVEGYQNILKLSCRPLAFTSYRAFLMLPCLIFGMIFEEKYFSDYILLTDQISMSGYLHFMRYWTICELWLFVNQVVTSKFWNEPYLSSQVVFSAWPKSQENTVNILRRKKAFKMK